jgi:hypothetical protein
VLGTLGVALRGVEGEEILYIGGNGETDRLESVLVSMGEGIMSLRLREEDTGGLRACVGDNRIGEKSKGTGVASD